MYDSKLIIDFIEKVNKEAEAAAKEVFNKYELELVIKVANQIKKGEELCLSMGSAYFTDIPSEQWNDAQEAFLDTLADLQYLKQNASFNIFKFKND